MHKRIMWGALAISVAGAATAQGAPKAGAADPGPARPGEYRSAFAGYRGFSDPEIADWRAVNDEVGRVGGHLGIARAQKDSAKDKPKPPAQGMQHK